MKGRVIKSPPEGDEGESNKVTPEGDEGRVIKSPSEGDEVGG